MQLCSHFWVGVGIAFTNILCCWIFYFRYCAIFLLNVSPEEKKMSDI